MKTRKQKEQEFWNSFAKKYDSFINERAFKTYKILYALLLSDTKNTKHLLELATGTGIHAFDLSKHIHQITATDISSEMIKIAKKKNKQNNFSNVNFQIEDSCNLSFANNSFDTILASNVLHLLYKPEWTLQEIKRVLTVNGKVILPTYCHGQNLVTHIISRIMGISGFKARSRWSLKSFIRFLSLNGFEVIKTEKIKDIIPMVYVVAKIKTI